MVSLEKSDSAVTTNVRYRMPAVHPEGRKFVVIAVGIVGGAGVMFHTMGALGLTTAANAAETPPFTPLTTDASRSGARSRTRPE